MSVTRIGLAALSFALLASSARAQRDDNPHGASVGTCITCHKATAWKPAVIAPTYKHAERSFPLDGAHKSASCGSCHKSLVFTQVAKGCASCHTDVHQGEFGTTCDQCHTTRSFIDQARMARAHEMTRFPLRGAHVAVACESCHARSGAGQAQYRGRPTTCVGCHLTNFRASKSPDHQSAGFTQDCASCHDVTTWLSGRFDHSTTPFPLVGAHKAPSCANCHADNVFKGKPTTCMSCHTPDYNKTVTPPHAASVFPTACLSCHTMQAWKGATFDHGLTQFPLTGAHVAALCTGCHADNVFKGKPTACMSCHQTDYVASVRPPHSSLAFSPACATCHTTIVWKGASFDHSTTAFPLTGAHKAAACTDCHANGVYRGRGTACVGCHQANYDKSTTPPHAAAGFPTTCATCHGTTIWTGATFNHDLTPFPLTGTHRTTLCMTCHSDNVYVGKPTACQSCHQKDYNASLRPPHSALAFSTACATCHSTIVWAGGAFDHTTTRFALAGAHKAVPCASCHGDGVYRGKPMACESCHLANYTATKNPPHASAGMPTTCVTCHTTTAWVPSGFDHNATLFPLAGAHKAALCTACHGDNVYKGKSTACASCHQKDYNASLRPPHSSLGFSAICSNCHGVTVWAGGTFDHSTTPFPLTGAHRAQVCASCHSDGVYKGKSMECVSCHQTNYTASKNPPHAAAGFPTTCATCHTTTAWVPSGFDHNATQFPLAGAHKAALCTACHGDNVYKGKPTACASCHQKDYTASLRPPHSALGFSAICSNCHGVTTWTGGSFDHSTTPFPLTGAHASQVCASCHSDGVYKGKPTTCVSCHQTNYTASKNPPHAAAGFPTTCATCHTTTAWVPSTGFDHNTTAFPLAGTHKTTPCISCHSDGVYKGKPTTCISCHQKDYNASLRPPHQSLGFSTACANCHGVTVWAGGSFDHSTTVFPLTGAHRAALCNDCHADGLYKTKPTDCYSCHQANYAASKTPPHAAASFPTLCASCHTTTAWSPATFNHTTGTKFPLTGAHIPLACASCHSDGVYVNRSTLCVSCHQAKYDATSNPNHKAANFPTDCVSCHTTTTWLGATFNHDGTFFPIYSGKHKGKWTLCTDCHTVTTNYALFLCTTCHTQKNMDSAHKGRAGYKYDSPTCYSCHPKGTKP